ERPDLRVRLRLESAIFQVPHEAGLINRHQGTKTHRDGRKLPEVFHQPRVRVRRQAASGFQFAPEVLEMRLVDAAFEIRTGIDARRRMTLKEDDVAVTILVTAEEMIEADFV